MRWLLLMMLLCTPACGSNGGDDDGERDGGLDAGTIDAGESDAGIALDDWEQAPPPCEVGEPSDPDVVATERGLLRGASDEAMRVFLGVPFAAPPTGELRWKPPAHHDCWEAERAATAFGDYCYQLNGEGPAIGREDCLTLNVFAPADATPGSLPIIVFIHGGGNHMGSGVLDGTGLVRAERSIVVTINYRLGLLGFLAHPSLTAESTHHSSGNYGLMDQLMALRWIQRNIRAFGGDPSRVTIDGQSAGGNDVEMLLTSPRARGLFAGAIVQSGRHFVASFEENEEYGEGIAERLGCTDASQAPGCLRALSVEELYEEARREDFEDIRVFPNVDGFILDETIGEAFLGKRWNFVPVMIGVNADEFPSNPPGLTMEQLRTTLVEAFGEDAADRVIEAYPVAEYGSVAAAANAMSNDVEWACPTRAAARALAGAERAPIYAYFFGRQGCHSCEVPYLGYLGTVPSTKDDAALASAMRRYWVNFAATGDPNGTDLPEWPAFESPDDAYLTLDVPIAREEGFRGAECDLWASLSSTP